MALAFASARLIRDRSTNVNKCCQMRLDCSPHMVSVSPVHPGTGGSQKTSQGSQFGKQMGEEAGFGYTLGFTGQVKSTNVDFFFFLGHCGRAYAHTGSLVSSNLWIRAGFGEHAALGGLKLYHSSVPFEPELDNLKKHSRICAWIAFPSSYTSVPNYVISLHFHVFPRRIRRRLLSAPKCRVRRCE